MHLIYNNSLTATRYRVSLICFGWIIPHTGLCAGLGFGCNKPAIATGPIPKNLLCELPSENLPRSGYSIVGEQFPNGAIPRSGYDIVGKNKKYSQFIS